MAKSKNQFLRKRVKPGDKFGLLYVLGRDKHRERNWLCLCDCGTVVARSTEELKSGEHHSCGYCRRGFNNGSSDRLYSVWRGMKDRCYNKRNKNYSAYGGRGIRICPEWLLSYQEFRNWALDNGYDEEADRGEHTIDRIDVNGDYEPNNCRWIDINMQQKNTRKYISKHSCQEV